MGYGCVVNDEMGLKEIGELASQVLAGIVRGEGVHMVRCVVVGMLNDINGASRGSRLGREKKTRSFRVPSSINVITYRLL